MPAFSQPPDNSLTTLAEPPLRGIRVVELGRFASAPSCATMLADWGADVIKIEPPTGDPARGPGSVNGGGTTKTSATFNPRFDVHNRSRRSVALDLTTPAGHVAALHLIASADVFVTNLRASALKRLGMDDPAIRTAYPRLVYAHITGYDPTTSQADWRSYDHGGFWSYSGVADLFAGADGEPPQPAGGLGDRATGSILAGAISAALLARERTQRGSYVSTSLVNVGFWLMASEVSDVIETGSVHRSADRREATVPTVNCFRTADARWLWLQVMFAERHWGSLLRALDAEWLDADPRFRGGDSQRLRASRVALIEALDEIFRQRTLTEWSQRLDDNRLTWAPVRSLIEAVSDPETRASTAFMRVVDTDGRLRQGVNSPCTFGDLPPRDGTAAPTIGEHTREVLTELGYTLGQVDTLALQGAFGDSAGQGEAAPAHAQGSSAANR